MKRYAVPFLVLLAIAIAIACAPPNVTDPTRIAEGKLSVVQPPELVIIAGRGRAVRGQVRNVSGSFLSGVIVECQLYENGVKIADGFDASGGLASDAVWEYDVNFYLFILDPSVLTPSNSIWECQFEA